MRWKYLLAVLVALNSLAVAENKTEQSPITMEQLMRELRIQGGNFIFTFDHPVFARVVAEVGNSEAERKKFAEKFSTAAAKNRIELFFSASEMFVGDYPKPNTLEFRKMLIKLSGCAATDQTPIIHYMSKFAQSDHAEYQPSIPAAPEIGKQYVLHWYFKQGDSYSAKVTIEYLRYAMARARNAKP